MFKLLFLEIDEHKRNQGKQISTKIVTAISKLKPQSSSILNNLETTRNWRDPFSIWGKLSKSVYDRNRLQFRAKLMNIWRNNNYDIHSQVKEIFIGLTLPISIDISKLS